MRIDVDRLVEGILGEAIDGRKFIGVLDHLCFRADDNRETSPGKHIQDWAPELITLLQNGVANHRNSVLDDLEVQAVRLAAKFDQEQMDRGNQVEKLLDRIENVLKAQSKGF